MLVIVGAARSRRSVERTGVALLACAMAKQRQRLGPGSLLQPRAARHRLLELEDMGDDVLGGLVRALTWNTEWATLRSWRSGPILERLERESADVAVLTETQLDLAHGAYPFVADAGPHPRSGQPSGSKVVIASRHPMQIVDVIGSPQLPEHNFVAIDVAVPDGGTIRVIGVVIHYRQKTQYVRALPGALARLVAPRTVLAGDFNMPMLNGVGLKRELGDVLDAAGLRVVTARPWPQLAGERSLIDHIALSPALSCHDVDAWPRLDPVRGKPMTDHAGVAVNFSSA